MDNINKMFASYELCKNCKLASIDVSSDIRSKPSNNKIVDIVCYDTSKRPCIYSWPSVSLLNENKDAIKAYTRESILKMYRCGNLSFKRMPSKFIENICGSVSDDSRQGYEYIVNMKKRMEKLDGRQ